MNTLRPPASLPGMIRAWAFLLAIVSLFVSQAGANPPQQPHGSATPSGQFLLFTDFHFNPFFDPALFPRLRQAEATAWNAILAESQPVGFNARGSDSNAALISSALADARQRCPRPDFILCAGDFLSHDWEEAFDRAAPGVRKTQPEVFSQFTINSLKFVAGQIARHFPGIPLYPTLGNEDSFCGDYELTPGGLFLRDFAEIFAPALQVDDGARKQFLSSASRHGCYVAPLPGVKGARLISVNSVFFSIDYHDDCESKPRQTGDEVLRWLEEQLAAAERHGQTAWLLMHIPPGIDAYETAKAVAAQRPAVPFWREADLAAFLKLAQRYSSTIHMVLAGHTHMDDFRVAQVDRRPVLLSKLAPAVSPVFGNNPAYQVYRYQPRTARITDYRTYRLPLPGSEPDGKSDEAPNNGRSREAAKAPAWEVEYEFGQAYPKVPFTPAGITRWAEGLAHDAAAAQRYRTYYAAGSSQTFAPGLAALYHAAIICASREEFERRVPALPNRNRRP